MGRGPVRVAFRLLNKLTRGGPQTGRARAEARRGIFGAPAAGRPPEDPGRGAAAQFPGAAGSVQAPARNNGREVMRR
jgi:hypothetical protein